MKFDKRNLNLKAELLTFAVYIILLRLKTNLLYILVLTLFALGTYQAHPTFSEIILGMILTLIIANTINQHYQEYRFRDVTRKIKTNIYSSFYNIYEIFRFLTDDFAEEVNNIQILKIPDGIKKLKELAKKKQTKNTINIPKNHLSIIRQHLQSLKNYINETNDLISVLSNDFEIYDIVHELENFSNVLPDDIEKNFDKKNSSPLELIIAGLNDSFLRNLIEKYDALLTRFEKNLFLKKIYIVPSYSVFTTPCEIEIPKDKMKLVSKQLKENQDI